MRSQPAIERMSLLRLIQHLRSNLWILLDLAKKFFFTLTTFWVVFCPDQAFFCHCRGSAASAANVLLWVYRWVCYLPGKVRMADNIQVGQPVGRASSRTLSVTFYKYYFMNLFKI